MPAVAPIPVTLLSGFLGAGKTTLLEHILKSDHGMKVAVIVNDVNALNVDGAQIANHFIAKQEARTELVQMQNGCICCTLRVDLLEEVARIAEKGGIDAIVIESTGISEPQQVAETFTADFTQTVLNESGEDASTIVRKIASLPNGLSSLARLDCCVTVLDCFNLLDKFQSLEIYKEDNVKEQHNKEMKAESGDAMNAETVASSEEGEEEKPEPTICELLVDQLEFADVVVLNKSSLVSASDKQRILALVKSLNPSAEVLFSDYSKIDVQKILRTDKFSLEKAQTSAGWLQSLHELQKRQGYGEDLTKVRLTPAPETEEFGISTWVYQRRGRPFHPGRLRALLGPHFGITEFEADLPEDEEDVSDDENEEESSSEEEEEEEEEDEEMPSCPLAPKQAILDARKAHPHFSRLYRSKGTFWLANRPYHRGVWSQAGALLTVEDGGPWGFLMLDTPDMLPQDAAAVEVIKRDVEKDKEFFDRRQEIVLIGEKIDWPALAAELDACLLTDDEMTVLRSFSALEESSPAEYEQALMAEPRLGGGEEDPWMVWAPMFNVLGEVDDEDEDEESDDEDGVAQEDREASSSSSDDDDEDEEMPVEPRPKRAKGASRGGAASWKH